MDTLFLDEAEWDAADEVSFCTGSSGHSSEVVEFLDEAEWDAADEVSFCTGSSGHSSEVCD